MANQMIDPNAPDPMSAWNKLNALHQNAISTYGLPTDPLVSQTAWMQLQGLRNAAHAQAFNNSLPRFGLQQQTTAARQQNADGSPMLRGPLLDLSQVVSNLGLGGS